MTNRKTAYPSGFSDFSIVLVFVALTIVGAALIPLLNIKLTPSPKLPVVSIHYNWHNASALIIEKEVTSKYEGALSTIKNIKHISSVSRKGNGEIKIELQKGSDLDLARFEISTILRRIYRGLPEGVTYPAIHVGENSESTTLLTYTISANTNSTNIQDFTEENIVPQLSKHKDINNIEVYGAPLYELIIVYNSSLIKQLNIKPEEITNALNLYFKKEVLGNAMVANLANNYCKELNVRLGAAYNKNTQWHKIPIKTIEERIIHLTDIAAIKYQEKPPNSYYRINGLNTINMVISATETANQVKAANRVKETIEQIKHGLPQGYAITLSYDSSEYIRKELNKIGLRSLFSLAILLVFIIVITRQVRYLLLIFISILANLVIAAIFYYLFKVEIHLYSLAGITVSFGIIIDNSIVMIDHYRHHKNKKVFLAILAATLTTIGALCVIFLLDEKQKLNLIDFASVIIVNLGVSVLIALFFIPSLLTKLPLQSKMNKVFFKRKKKILQFNNHYYQSIVFLKKHKTLFILVAVFGFGLPIHLLPDKLEGNKWQHRFYNSTLGSDTFYSAIKPKLESIMGGSLRLFSENIFESSFYSEPQRTKLYVNGKMPEGCTIHQLNKAIKKMEAYISGFSQVELFETTITSYRNSSIVISFTPEEENGSFPYELKNLLTSKAISLGGVDWSVYGVGRGFSNALYSNYKNNQIRLEGYNYEQLYAYAAQLQDMLKPNKRVKDIEIAGQVSWNSELKQEYFIDFNTEKLASIGIPISVMYNQISSQIFTGALNRVFYNNKLTPVSLASDRASNFNSWWLRNEPFAIDSTTTKISDLGTLGKQKTGNDIYKTDQQYRLIVAWEFIGPDKLAQRVTKEHEIAINKILPMGYKARQVKWTGWDSKNKKQYYLIFIVILIIFFVCSVLLESFRQPLAIILLVPISFIGVFLTFYLFNFTFDQGGFASFILLCGIVVNSGLYIVNDFNNLKKHKKGISDTKLFIKAFNHKIIPIFLTVFSTMLGLLPFVAFGQNEVFWFAFAVGTMGGLVISIPALLIYFPLFLKLKGG